MTKTDSLVSSLIENVAIDTLEKFKIYMAEKVELDDDMLEIFESFKKDLGKQGTKSSGTKQKKALSPYNIYIQNKIKELKEQGHTGNVMKLAIQAYNEEKKNTVSESSEQQT